MEIFNPASPTPEGSLASTFTNPGPPAEEVAHDRREGGCVLAFGFSSSSMSWPGARPWGPGASESKLDEDFSEFVVTEPGGTEVSRLSLAFSPGVVEEVARLMTEGEICISLFAISSGLV
jgi:hypothetical protein